ncbi:DUF397 domain-containing protein [Streptomyces sp. NPDC057638]|uniref:DUF397 domain-containing protein n=1 Tax=Streptomyces sp. NPDC057638 TaxID=3346190 RepID=UPI0036CEB0F3
MSVHVNGSGSSGGHRGPRGGGECAETALVWRKSSYSASGAGQCVEVAARPRTVHVRDSKDVRIPGIAVDRSTWVLFVAYAAGRSG